MKDKRSKAVKERWEKLCKSISRKSNPFAGMNKDGVINALRRTREKLWGEKLATRP